MEMVPAGSSDDLEVPPVISEVSAADHSRLFFAWGAGPQINICEVHNPDTQVGGDDPSASTVSW